MTTYGPRDLSTLVLYTGSDATELRKWQLEDGTTAEQVYALLNGALGALNIEFRSGLWGSLCYFTDEPEVSYRVGSSNGMSVHTEYSRPDPNRADTEGHMLPLIPYDRHLQWTWDYLRKARRDQIEADVADAIKDARDKWRVSILTRLLKRGDDSGTNKGLGSSGYSPGFATTAASTSVDFTPPSFGGNSFASTHEHYVAIAGGAYTNAVFEDAYDELREHGHQPPFDFIISSSDRTVVEALSKFTKRADLGVRLGSTQNEATVSDDYIGVIENFYVREEWGMPQYYGIGYKSYGQNSARNPLRVRLTKGTNQPTVVAMRDPYTPSANDPLSSMMLFTEFGVGVFDRTAASPRYVNNATWSDGTPT